VSLDLDTLATDEPIIRESNQRARVERLRRHRLTQTGTLPTYAEIDAELRERRQNRYEGSHGAFPEHRSLADHLS